MEDTQSVAMLIDSTTSKIQQLQKAFAELESHRAVALNLKWKQLEEHFHGLEKSLKRRFNDLEDQEKEYKTKTMKARVMLEEREAAVMAKEQASLEKLQEKRDAAVSVISNTLEKHRKFFPVEPVVITSEGKGGAPFVEEKPPDAMAAESNLDLKNSSENGKVELMSYPQLVILCQEMDSEGLHKFISDNRKNLTTLREEIPLALKAAVDPGCLVLDSLKGFYSMEMPHSNLLGLRRTCIMLMECLSILLTDLDLSSVSDVISEDVKERAKAIAEEWKPKLDDLDVDASNGNSLEAHAFLQLLATFRINSDFDQENLSKLIPMVSRRRQTADLCRALGLSDKMPGVIDVLVNNGRQIDAVNLAFAFELTEQFSPVLLLKSYLTEARKVSSPVKSGNTSPTVQDQILASETLPTAANAYSCLLRSSLGQSSFVMGPILESSALVSNGRGCGFGSRYSHIGCGGRSSRGGFNRGSCPVGRGDRKCDHCGGTNHTEAYCWVKYGKLDYAYLLLLLDLCLPVLIPMIHSLPSSVNLFINCALLSRLPLFHHHPRLHWLIQNEVSERELTALKAVIKCIEDHKLEEQYSLEPLQKQVQLLEKAKADKKWGTEVAKPQPKRPRANGVGYGPRVTNFATDKNYYPRMTDRYPQYMYDRPYVYTGPTDNHVPSLLGSATYNLSPSHGNYFGNGYQYQAPYLH